MKFSCEHWGGIKEDAPEEAQKAYAEYMKRQKDIEVMEKPNLYELSIRLHNEEKVLCNKCKKYIYIINGNPKTSNFFRCDNCGDFYHSTPAYPTVE